MKNTINRPLLKTALFSAFALTCATALAQTGPILVFTEDPTSALGLTAEVGGASYGTVALETPVRAPIQVWDWTPPAGTPFNVIGSQPLWWIEPDNLPSQPPTYNQLSYVAPAAGLPFLEIMSDTPQGGFIATSTFKDGTVVNNWMVEGNTVYGVQYIDEGDVSSTVPDGSSTLTLLGGVLTVVGAVGRKLGK